MARERTQATEAINRPAVATNRSEVAVTSDQDRTRQIAVLAYQLWLERGCPEGSPEEDWHRAEQQIQAASDAVKGVAATSQTKTKPLTKTAGSRTGL